jgi:hypothetical protein
MQLADHIKVDFQSCHGDDAGTLRRSLPRGNRAAPVARKVEDEAGFTEAVRGGYDLVKGTSSVSQHCCLESVASEQG